MRVSAALALALLILAGASIHATADPRGYDWVGIRLGEGQTCDIGFGYYLWAYEIYPVSGCAGVDVMREGDYRPVDNIQVCGFEDYTQAYVDLQLPNGTPVTFALRAYGRNSSYLEPGGYVSLAMFGVPWPPSMPDVRAEAPYEARGPNSTLVRLTLTNAGEEVTEVNLTVLLSGRVTSLPDEAGQKRTFVLPPGGRITFPLAVGADGPFELTALYSYASDWVCEGHTCRMTSGTVERNLTVTVYPGRGEARGTRVGGGRVELPGLSLSLDIGAIRLRLDELLAWLRDLFSSGLGFLILGFLTLALVLSGRGEEAARFMSGA